MTRAHSLYLLAAGTAFLHAQPRHLATDHRGSVLYFAANMTDDPKAGPGYSRIFRWEPQTGITVFVERPPEFVDGARRSTGTPEEGVESPSVSADGSRVAYVSHITCLGCGRFPQPYTIAVVTGRSGAGSTHHAWLPENEVSFWLTEGHYLTSVKRNGRVEISRNGRYLVCRGGWMSSIRGVYDLAGDPMPLDGCRLAGVPRALRYPVSESGTRQMLADSGAAVLGLEGRLYQAPVRSDSRPISEIDAMAPATNASGTVVVYETLPQDGRRRQLLALDRQTGRQWFLWEDPVEEYPGKPVALDGYSLLPFFLYPYPPIAGQLFGASIDAEGRQVAILAREQADEPRRWLVTIPLDGSPPVWLKRVEEGLLELTLSGDGRVAFVTTATGRILRIAVESGDTAELLGPTPWIGSLVGAPAAGARNRIHGGGFATMTHISPEVEGVEELAGVRVEYDGQPMPLFQVSPAEIIYRIPPSFAPPPPGAFAFSATVSVRARAASGRFMAAPFRRMLRIPLQVIDIEPPGAIGEDDQAISLFRPLIPGETIRLLATGWEESLRKVECELQATVSVSVPGAFPVEVLSFGGAAGRPGLFELRLRTPELVSITQSPLVRLQCTGGDPLRVLVLDMPLQL